jgi:hypothetical protein
MDGRHDMHGTYDTCDTHDTEHRSAAEKFCSGLKPGSDSIYRKKRAVASPFSR